MMLKSLKIIGRLFWKKDKNVCIDVIAHIEVERQRASQMDVTKDMAGRTFALTGDRHPSLTYRPCLCHRETSCHWESRLSYPPREGSLDIITIAMFTYLRIAGSVREKFFDEKMPVP